jgi:drug/metabolite transporter (DMT)-like permease
MAFVALGVIWGIPYFFIKLAVLELSPLVVGFGRLALATAVLLPIAWRRGALKSLGGHMGAIGAPVDRIAVALAVPALLSLPEHMPSAVVQGSIVILGVICTAVAMLLMFFLISDVGAARSSVITYINPVVAALLGSVVLHERLGLGGIAAQRAALKEL